jgi:hypothetical protein
MKLDKFIENLTKLQAAGHGDLEVFYVHGASGDSGYLGHPSVNVIDGSELCGALVDWTVGEKYISVYAGN